MTDPLPTTDPLDEAFAAYLKSCDEGNTSSREEFLAQFPELAGELKQLIEAADMIGRISLSSGGILTGKQPVSTGADTVALDVASPSEHSAGELSGGDPAITLPIEHRSKGDPGPTLPFDLGDYQLLKVLGRGGMGVVYLAKQKHLQRQVAVKMIRSGILAGEDEVRRFYTEAQAAARLKHPGIVSVYQFGHLAGHHYFSMEFVDGTDLQRKINDKELSIHESARYVRDVARAIGHAHNKGVLHRDLKPANVLIDNEDNIHVTDFGLAKHMDGDSSVTGSGTAIGTPHYMAPEQAGGQSDRAVRQSDVYSLGAILFACLSGRPPIVADTVMQTLIQVVHHPAPSVRTHRPETPADLETIVAKCLEKSPAKRYPSADRLADDLDAFLEARPITARPRSMLLKAWHWFEGVPLVAALLGRRLLAPSTSHRRFQACMLGMFLLTPILLAIGLTVIQQSRQAMPRHVVLAGGIPGGVYDDLAERLASRLSQTNSVETSCISSSGSLDNRARLLARDVLLAPMQASAVNDERLCVVAPLFFEAVHLLARDDSGVTSITQLAGHRCAVGPDGSGSRIAAELVFDSFELTPEVLPREVTPWINLASDDAPDVAVICIGRGNRLVAELLTSGRWKLLPIENGIRVSLQHPTLRPMTISADEYDGAALPTLGIDTVGTTAFLAAQLDSPDILVEATLTALYQSPEIIRGLIPLSRAAEWQGLAMHPAARRFYQRASGTEE